MLILDVTLKNAIKGTWETMETMEGATEMLVAVDILVSEAPREAPRAYWTSQGTGKDLQDVPTKAQSM